MGLPDQTQTTSSTTTSQSHLYPQALQLKLYQAFIFSIPILFSIILFLLFYLFYLKRRASTLSSSPPILIRRRNHNQASASYTPYVSSVSSLSLSLFLSYIVSSYICFLSNPLILLKKKKQTKNYNYIWVFISICCEISM